MSNTILPTKATQKMFIPIKIKQENLNIILGILYYKPAHL